MRTGANIDDVRMIKKLHAEGLEPKDISVTMNIDIACVESFVDQLFAPPKGKKTEKKKKPTKTE